MPLTPGLHEVRIGVLAGFSKASLVFSLNPELVFLAWSQTSDLTIRELLGFDLGSSGPVLGSVFPVLNGVAGHRSSILTKRNGPLEFD